MRFDGIPLILLILLILPNHTSAKQDVAASGKKSDTQSIAKKNPGTVTENWRVLDDLKTGLDPHAAVVVQSDEQPDFVRDLLRVQWRIVDPIDVWLIRPKVTGKVPVVLYLYSYSDTS